MSGAPNEDYPEQHHSGAVGYGPDYHRGATFGDKMSGLTEEVKGKVTRKPELVEHGRDMRTGELKRRAREKDNGPEPTDSAGSAPSAGPGATSQSNEVDRGHERAATVASSGTEAVDRQRTGSDESVKMMSQ
ncbi:hypothetical protein NEOLEDRAFT_1142609 [Neolentinus lepideus HHB14362 ss-1]|uniref:Uncharacterized protein n=1 Tax=Neolentinus lepideus HHB14362 ss-1 TaxID=1314782 RepID=A0A165N0J4_9AGAM|nr:hypothetical protein NEOLEDRAFT_1142609 [Neolentinus lepideus HHB14362 ss-1]